MIAAITRKLTIEEFETQYGSSNKGYEYWYGEAIPKSMPTWVHGLLQSILSQLLREAGFFAGSEVEFRIDPDARPGPDVSATRDKPRGSYPTVGLDVVVEIISEDDKVSIIREHCQKYDEWGCQQIYLVDPSDRSVVRWQNGSMIVSPELAGIPVSRIRTELDSQFERE